MSALSPATEARAYADPREQLAYLMGWQAGAEAAEHACTSQSPAAVTRLGRYKAEARHESVTAALAITIGGMR